MPPIPIVSIRTKYFDDLLVEVTGRTTIRQVVLLGVGMDVRSCRMPWAEQVIVYEVDRAEVFSVKESILQALHATPRISRVVVSTDLDGGWVTDLVAAGFSVDEPAAFLAEGILTYMDPDSAAHMLGVLREIACPGSWLGLDVAGTELLTWPRFQPVLSWLEQLGCPWRFSTSNPDSLLDRYSGHSRNFGHFMLSQSRYQRKPDLVSARTGRSYDYGRYSWEATICIPGEPAADYGRWSYPAVPRSVPGIPLSYLVIAYRRGWERNDGVL